MWFVGNTEGGFVVNKPRGLTIDGIQYPRNIFTLWSKTELAAIGIKPYSETSPDKRYYNAGAVTRTVVNGEVVGTYAAMPKDVTALKETMLDKVKAAASGLQNATDWYWARATKGNKPVPQEVVDHAESVYTMMDTKEAAIEALLTVEEVMAYQNTPAILTTYIKHTSEEGVETYGPETTVTETEIDQSSHGWPSLEVDPSFVSITF